MCRFIFLIYFIYFATTSYINLWIDWEIKFKLYLPVFRSKQTQQDDEEERHNDRQREKLKQKEKETSQARAKNALKNVASKFSMKSKLNSSDLANSLSKYVRAWCTVWLYRSWTFNRVIPCYAVCLMFCVMEWTVQDPYSEMYCGCFVRSYHPKRCKYWCW